MIRNITLTAGSLAIIASTGCVSLNQPISSVFGEAYEANLAAQIVDETPAEGAPAMDAQKSDAAIERYRTDQIKEPTEAKSVDFADSGDG